MECFTPRQCACQLVTWPKFGLFLTLSPEDAIRVVFVIHGGAILSSSAESAGDSKVCVQKPGMRLRVRWLLLGASGRFARLRARKDLARLWEWDHVDPMFPLYMSVCICEYVHE